MKFSYGVCIDNKPFGQIFHFEGQGFNGSTKNLNGDPYPINKVVYTSKDLMKYKLSLILWQVFRGLMGSICYGTSPLGTHGHSNMW